MPEQVASEKHPRHGARVFMTNMGFHDYSAAERWGDFVPITQGRVDLVHTDRLEGDIQKVLSEYQSGLDYLMLGGAPIVVAMAIGYLFARDKYVDVLYWDAMYADYRHRKLTFQDRNLALEEMSGRKVV